MVATIIIGIVILAIVVGVVVKLVKNKKAGKSSYSCGCGGCAMKDCCSGDKKVDATTNNQQ